MQGVRNRCRSREGAKLTDCLGKCESVWCKGDRRNRTKKTSGEQQKKGKNWAKVNVRGGKGPSLRNTPTHTYPSLFLVLIGGSTI